MNRERILVCDDEPAARRGAVRALGTSDYDFVECGDGRACVHEDFRNIMVLHALWKGIAVYATRVEARYLLGCSSISSQDENYGIALYNSLKEKYLVEPALRTEPQPGCACIGSGEGIQASRPPRLFRAYLEISGRICGTPAIDREFKTIDFLTLVDLAGLPDRVRSRFF